MTHWEETSYSYEQSYLYISLKSFLHFWLMWITESPSADMTDMITQLPGREDNFIENWNCMKEQMQCFSRNATCWLNVVKGRCLEGFKVTVVQWKKKGDEGRWNKQGTWILGPVAWLLWTVRNLTSIICKMEFKYWEIFCECYIECEYKLWHIVGPWKWYLLVSLILLWLVLLLLYVISNKGKLLGLKWITS